MNPLGEAMRSASDRSMCSIAVHTPDDLTIGFDGRFLQDKFSGIGRYAFGLLKGLASLDGSHNVLVFVDDSLPNSRFPLSELRGLDHVELIRIRTPLRSLGRESIYWWNKAQCSRFDIFHTPEFWSPLAMPCPVISTVHDMIPDISRDYLSSRA